MKKDGAAKRLFKEEHPVDIVELVRIDVPIVQDTSYDTGFLVSDNLDDLETGIIAARKVGDFCWYAIACSIAKIIDGAYIHKLVYPKKSMYCRPVNDWVSIKGDSMNFYLQAVFLLIMGKNC